MQSKIAAGAGGPTPKANIMRGELNGGSADNGPPASKPFPLPGPKGGAKLLKTDRKPQE